jgi:hypothetical protein
VLLSAVDACARSLALAIGAFVLTLVGVVHPAPAGLAFAAAGVLLYAAARSRLSRC